MRLVLDTNVIVSMLLSENGAEATLVLDYILGRDTTESSPAYEELLATRARARGFEADPPSWEFVVLVDDRIIAEYREVLARPKFRAKISAELADAVVDVIEARAFYVDDPPALEGSATPAQDLPFLEVAIAGDAHAIVTGNRKHFTETGNVAVMNASALVKKLAGDE